MKTVVLAHGPGGMFDLFPLVMLGAAAFVIWTALRDGSDKRNATRTLPTNPFSRQLHAALRPQRPERSAAPSPERGPRRRGGTPLQVMEGGEAGEKNRPKIPQRFEPAPPSRRKIS